jgi:20S proteasome alpha/beta subunit
MTIAAGFNCADGIVLAVDSQYSAGIAKVSGQKIFPLWQTDRYSVTLAAAGSVGMAKRAVGIFKDLVEQKVGAGSTTLAELQGFLEDALCAVYAKHIYPAPPNERSVLDFWLLMAAWTPDGRTLYRTDITAVNPVQGSSCIGIGSYLGDYLMALLCHHSPLEYVEDVKPIAAYIIKSAKDFVEDCGLTTFIRVLTDRGIDERVSHDEIGDAEECFDSMFRSFRLCIDGAMNVSVPLGGNLLTLSQTLKTFVGIYRDKQLRRRAVKSDLERKLSRFSNPAIPPNPPSPTADPSPLPPLPESHEGPDES